ncbi:hypothetical protein HK096_001453 [Nowakowskiella sp. JEL0078]|nr:hypothetical protein HK096_001453 [Nowakowskiella sp. JEL0078]
MTSINDLDINKLLMDDSDSEFDDSVEINQPSTSPPPTTPPSLSLTSTLLIPNPVSLTEVPPDSSELEDDVMQQLANLGLDTPARPTRESTSKRPEFLAKLARLSTPPSAPTTTTSSNRRDGTLASVYQVLDKTPGATSADGALTFASVDLADLIDRVLDRVEVEAGFGDDGGGHKGLLVRLRTFQSTVTELGRRINKFQKFVFDAQQKIEMGERVREELEAQVETLQLELKVAQEVASVSKIAAEAAEQAIVDAAADAAAAAASAAYAQIRQQQAEKENSRKKSRSFSVLDTANQEAFRDVITGSYTGLDRMKSRSLKFGVGFNGEEGSHNHERKILWESSDGCDTDPENEKSFDPFDPEFVNKKPVGTRITKPVLIDAAKMLSAKKKFDPPTSLGVGLKITGDKDDLLMKNPYQHVKHTCAGTLEASNFRKKHINRLTQRVSDHHHHLSTVLSLQTRQLLATTNPDEYIRVLHIQLSDSLHAIHDCIDALAEEQHASSKWRRRYEHTRRKFDRFVENHFSHLSDVTGEHPAIVVPQTRTLGLHRNQFIVNTLIPVVQTGLFGDNEGGQSRPESRRSKKSQSARGYKRLEPKARRRPATSNTVVNTLEGKSEGNGKEYEEKATRIRLKMPTITTLEPFADGKPNKVEGFGLNGETEAAAVMERNVAFHNARQILHNLKI